MSIIQQVTPITHDLGGFQVRRAIPSPQLAMIGPFVFVDQFGPAVLQPGMGMDVRPHPHINLATVTWLFEGAIGHRDSLGTDSVIHPGTVNLMTAGSGIVHSERSPETERTGGPHLYGMQTWLALPLDREDSGADFGHTRAEELPVLAAGLVCFTASAWAVFGRRYRLSRVFAAGERGVTTLRVGARPRKSNAVVIWRPQR